MLPHFAIGGPFENFEVHLPFSLKAGPIGLPTPTPRLSLSLGHGASSNEELLP